MRQPGSYAVPLAFLLSPKMQICILGKRETLRLHNHFAAKCQDDAKIAKIHTNLILEKFKTKKTDQTKQSR